jgi:hypothetical protein
VATIRSLSLILSSALKTLARYGLSVSAGTTLRLIVDRSVSRILGAAQVKATAEWRLIAGMMRLSITSLLHPTANAAAKQGR